MTRHTHKVNGNRLTLTKAAELLGVTREHLSRVRHGRRISRSLTRRYRELLARYANTNGQTH